MIKFAITIKNKTGNCYFESENGALVASIKDAKLFDTAEDATNYHDDSFVQSENSQLLDWDEERQDYDYIVYISEYKPKDKKMTSKEIIEQLQANNRSLQYKLRQEKAKIDEFFAIATSAKSENKQKHLERMTLLSKLYNAIDNPTRKSVQDFFDTANIPASTEK